MNCLVTAIGSFSGVAVISSLKKNKISKIVGTDIYPKTWIPSSTLVDFFYQVPIFSDETLYLNKLIEIIIVEQIEFIIPLTDPEVDFLSKNRNQIECYNVIICIPNDETISICRDKLTFYNFFKKNIKVNLIPTFEPFNYLKSFYDFPIIAKLKNGRSSEGLYIIDSEEELNNKLNKLHNYILQPLFKGEIYTVDLIRDNKRNKSFAISRKELIRTKNGAGMSVEVSYNKHLNALAEYIGRKLNINGCINIEFIFKDGKYYLMDINPRFSAGISFSIIVGYDMVINHLNCFTGNEIQKPIIYKKMTIAKMISEVITSIEK